MLEGRKVKMFRCQIDPMIGGIPRNAFMVEDLKMEAHIYENIGVYVKVLATPNRKGQTEHLVPFANIQSIEFLPEEAKVTKLKKSEAV